MQATRATSYRPNIQRNIITEHRWGNETREGKGFATETHKG